MATFLLRVRRQLRLYGVLFRASMRAQGQYRANLIVEIVGAIAFQGAGFAFVWVVVDRFGEIGGWGLPELALLYGLRLGSHGVFTFFFAQLVGRVGEVIRQGEFDRYLVRPLDPLLQLMTRRFNLTVLGDLLGGVALIVAGASRVDVTWTVPAVGFLVLAVIGGGLVEAALHLMASGLAFRLLSTHSLSMAIEDLLSGIGGYPLRIFPGGAEFVLTFVLPIAFVAYFPAAVLLRRTDELAVPAALAVFAPLIGALLFAAAYTFWRRQIRYYSSSGT